MLKIEVFSENRDALGEGPLWDQESQRLYWIDSYGPTIHSADLDGGTRRRWSLPEPIGSMALRSRGGAVVALRSGFFLLDFESGALRLLEDCHPGNLRTRLNDGKTDRQGRFLAGSMDHEESEAIGALFSLDQHHAVSTLDQGFVCSNGPCFSPDGGTLYFADSFRRLIFAYDYDQAEGRVRGRRIFASLKGFQGYPDGATVDSEGYLWCVEVYAGRLLRFDPSGALDRVIGLPVFSSTSIAFGGPNLDIAFVTSMARPFAGRAPLEREAGMLFAISGLGVAGIAETRFAG